MNSITGMNGDAPSRVSSGGAPKSRPILFSAPMVRAILDGRKTQTRRVVKLPGAPMHLGIWEPSTIGGEGCTTKPGGGDPVPEQVCIWHTRTGATVCSPYGVPGDRLWVRETWGINHFEHCRPNPIPKARPADVEDRHMVYFATEDDCEIRNEMPQSPAIHMPRWASRITLEITEVRVERLNDCSVEDAFAEGLEVFNFTGWGDERGLPPVPEPDCYRGFPGADWDEYAPAAYAALWDHINGPGSWAANPWVWAVAFRRVEHQPDQPTTNGRRDTTILPEEERLS